MVIADLFVNLGIKGTDKTKSQFNEVESGLKGVKSMSLEAKAAIVGFFYGIEEMMRGSAQRGQALINFSALTGMEDVELQKWEKASERAGNVAGSVQSTVTGLQRTMAQLRLNKGMPEYFELFAQSFENFDRLRASTDSMYLLGKERDFAKATRGGGKEAIGNEILYGMGANEGFISSSRQGKLDQNKLNSMPILSHAQNQALADTNASFVKMWQDIQKQMDLMVVSTGPDTVKFLTEISHGLIELTKSLMDLAAFLDLGGFTKGALEVIPKLINISLHPIKAAGKLHDDFIKLSNMGKKNFIPSKLDFSEQYDKLKLAEKALPNDITFEHMISGNTVNINTTLNGIEEVDYTRLNQDTAREVNKAFSTMPQGLSK